MPSIPGLTAVHAEMLDLLKLFDGFCAANGVAYSLHGGTLLGAIREKGFIPWDDDTDVTFTRAEYEKFCAAAHRGLPDGHMVFSEFSAQHPRLWLRRPGRPGAWIDLFIYDYISERPLPRRLRLLGCLFFLAFTKTKKSLEISRRAGVQRGMRAKLMTFGYLLGRPFSAKAKARLMDFYCKRAFPGRRTQIHRSNDQYSGLGTILPASVMERYVRVPFEDAELMVTARYDEVLRSSYGADYMTPKRIASHDNPAHAGFVGGGE